MNDQETENVAKNLLIWERNMKAPRMSKQLLKRAEQRSAEQKISKTEALNELLKVQFMELGYTKPGDEAKSEPKIQKPLKSVFAKKFDHSPENGAIGLLTHLILLPNKETYMNKGQLIEAVQNLGKDTSKAAAEAAVNAVFASITKAVKRACSNHRFQVLFGCKQLHVKYQPTNTRTDQN